MRARTAINGTTGQSTGRRWRFAVLAVIALGVLTGAVGPAQSAFPGANGMIAFTSDRDGLFPELFLLDTATLQATKVAEVAAGGGVPENPVWSPDGGRIAFSRAGAIEVYEPATGGLQTINGDFANQPAWSPDGSMIAFTRFDEGRRGIWRMNADGSGEIRLTHGEDQDPAWSPDGGSIAFTKRRHFTEAGFILADSVYAMNPDGSGQVRMDHEVYCCSQADPAWSPDGETIALAEDWGGGHRISVLDVDLNEGVNPVTDFDHDLAPAWSPDGTQIVFERATAGGYRALFAVPAGGQGSPTPLTGNPPAFDTSPDWQPLPAQAGASPTCSIGATRAEEGNSGGAQASFEVDCDNPTPNTYSLDYASSDAPGHQGTAQPHIDYVPAAGSVSVPPGKSHSQIHVSLVGDTEPEPHETIWVTISSNGFLIDNDAAQATATIVDDDGFQVSVETRTVVEGDSDSAEVPVRVRLSHPADQLVDVFVHAVTPAGARSGYHDVNFAPGETEKVITYPVAGDLGVEGDERVEFAPVSWVVTDANSESGVLTIVDDDVAVLSIQDVRVDPEGDFGLGMATFTVTRSDVHDDVSFRFDTEDGSATAGDDYLGGGAPIAFPPGETTVEIAVPIVGDLLDEPDETFRVRLSNPSNASILDGEAVARIVDDDAEPSLSIDDVPVDEGDTAPVTAHFTARLSAPSGKTVTVQAATAPGSATAPGDYQDVPARPLTFDPGVMTQAFDVDVNGDTDVEADETFTVELFDAVNATIGDSQGLGTIVDHDAHAALSINDPTVVEGDAGETMARFTVTRTHSFGAVSFEYASESATATPGDDFVASAGFIPFEDGSATATIDIPVVGDLADEPDETFGVRLTSATNATIADEFGVATIEDDDPEPSVSIDDVSVREGNTGTTTARFTVRLLAPSGRPVSVDYATADGTAEAPGDYAAAAATVTFAPGTPTTRTFDVGVNGDGVLEPDETFAVALSGAQNASIGDGQGVGTIVDDEAPANDDFADAEALTGAAQFDTSFATIEPGEPGLAEAAPASFPTVWYRFSSPGRGVVELGAFGLFVHPTRLSVYTGTTLNGLTVRARADGLDVAAPKVVFPTVAGQDYLVQIVGPSNIAFEFPPGIGRGTLNLDFNPAPGNDDFADAAPLGVGSAQFDTAFASIEPGEPGLASDVPDSYPSVWYKLSPGSGAAALRLQSLTAFAPKRLSIYTGDALTGLTLVARADNSGGIFPLRDPSLPVDVNLEFPTLAGRVYHVQVLAPSMIAARDAGIGIGGGTLSMAFEPAPANDAFAAAEPVSSGSTPFATSFATVEAGEPYLASPAPEAYPSVWYRLSPGPGGAMLQLQSNATSAARQLSIYTGDTLNGLTLVAQADNSDGSFPQAATTPFGDVFIEFPTAMGRVYYVQVLARSKISSGDAGTGRGVLRVELSPAPPNDDFAGAALLDAGLTPFSTAYATVEADEPGLVSSIPEAYPSVWYRFNPGLGTVALRAQGVDPRQLSVYSGANLGALTLLARGSTPSPFPGAVGNPVAAAVDLDVRTTCGTTYYVHVLAPWAFPLPGRSAFDPTAGQGTLTRDFQPTPVPTNDAFANAATLNLGITTLPRDWWTCMTAEPSEPAHGGAPAAHSIWYRTTVGSGRVTVDSPGNRVAVYQGASFPLTRVADGASGQASFLTQGGTFLVAVEGAGGTTVDLSHTPGEVVMSTAANPTTDSEMPFDGATSADPVETALIGPAGTLKTIFETRGTTAPSAWTFPGWKVEITAPPLQLPSRYSITFRVDASLVTGLSAQQELDVFRNGVAVPSCSPPPPPDPCVSGRSRSGGDRIVTVSTSQASTWTFGIPRTTRGTALGLLQPDNGGDAEFLVTSNGTTVAGAFSYGIGDERFVATTVNALGIQGSTAWLAGVGRDGRTFLAYVEDNGAASSDRFRLWIGGVERTGSDGGLRAGNIVVRQ